jgi:hypothetical protein
MMEAIHIMESRRLALQSQLDSMKTQAERNKQGQFATPTELANNILEYAQALVPSGSPVRFLDPAVGTGSFFSALLKAFSPAQIGEAVGYEIDPSYANEASQFWDDDHLRIYNADFTRALPPVPDEMKANLLICNPPYVRHHHLLKAEKQRLRIAVEQAVNIRLSEQSGLYCHFLCLSHLWLSEGGLAGWPIPSEFLEVNYGEQIRKYLRECVTLLRIHRFDPKEVQFSDALVSSAVVWFRKSKPPIDHEVEFTFGGTLKQPRLSHFVSHSALNPKAKWTKLSLIKMGVPVLIHNDAGSLDLSAFTLSHGNITSEQSSGSYQQSSFADFTKPALVKAQNTRTLADLFQVKRGLATGANNYFILNERQIAENRIPTQFLRPVLPGPRVLSFDEVMADDEGFPLVENRQFLLTCDLPEAEIQARYESLWEYLQMGVKTGIHKGYICSHRTPWYMQEKRPACMFLCAYMGRQDSKRGAPFRFILNHSKATATNAYHMLYPRPQLQKALEANPQLATVIWQALNTISQDSLIGEGRVYGGGLHKMEPRELANVPADNIFASLGSYAAMFLL